MKLIRTTLFILSAIYLSSCGKTTGSVDVTDTESAFSLRLVTFQSLAETNWLIDSSSNLNTNSRTIAITGTCSRGGASAAIKIDGTPVVSPPTCSTLSEFSWNHTFGSDAVFTLQFIPVLGDGTSGSNSISKTIKVDTVAPAAPTITTNGGANMVTSSAAVTLNGTTSVDANRMTVSDSTGTFSFNSGASTFQLLSTLSIGESRTFSFTSYDFAGNASASTSMVVSYITGTNLVIADMTGSVLTAPLVSTTHKLVSVSVSPFLTGVPLVTSTPDNYKKYIGVTNVSAAKSQ